MRPLIREYLASLRERDIYIPAHVPDEHRSRPVVIAGRAAHAADALKRNDLDHCTLQLWLPGEDTEDDLYTDAEAHGAAFTDIPVTEDPGAVLQYVLRECGEGTPFYGLSAIASGHWPIVAAACRHYRLPIPPHLWTGLLPGCGVVAASSAAPPC